MPDHIYENERQLKEIILALFYDQYLKHGTAGHNRLNLIARLAKKHGMRLTVKYELSDRGQIIHRSNNGSKPV